ncbi:MAG: hypothetical protein H0U42_05305 [Thermoleophilaceae bacterium]|nr:hypothetical protein [Thermoleophilaceae bacterium]
MNEGAASEAREAPAAPTAESGRRADQLMDVLENFLAAACQADERLARRLCVADTVWTTYLTDADQAFTIYLDRFPIEFRRDEDPSAEVKVYGSVADNIDAWTGRNFLGLAIANGTVTYEGPVRKVLRVVPMFRPLGRHGDFRTLVQRSSAS